MIRLLLSTVLFLSLFSAKSQESPLAPFENLMNKTWVLEGKWGNGTIFKQETAFEYGLGEKIIIARSRGFTDPEQTTFGDRNYGVRKYDEKSGKILFWEFDVFGGTTTGEVLIESQKISYIYDYDGAKLADVWEYQSDTTYSLKVGSYEEGRLGQVYMNGTVILKGLD